MTQREGLEKMAKHCLYQERCQLDVRLKLFASGLTDDEVDNIICDLIAQNFIDELRFARAFSRGKFNIKGWGKIKIKQHLKQKKISDYCIKKGLSEISSEDYYFKLTELLQKKTILLNADNEFIKKQKLARFLIGKGFESEMVWEELS